LTVAGLSFSLDPTGGSDPVGSNIAINDNLTGLDIYSLRGVLQDANGFINPLVTLTFTSTSGTVFSSTDLPAFQPNPSQFEIIGLRVSATVNGQNQAQYRGDNAQIGIVAAVPAPGAVTIFCLGLAGLAMARRKRAIRPAL
jgi:hypothetical protein